jgi:glucosamine--fructose-6-phosphate aminotransferase (isomerizing)
LKNEHVLLREIHEQPIAMRETLDAERRQISEVARFLGRKHLHFLGMGSSYFASLYAKYLFQEQRLVEAHLASEFVHYPLAPEPKDVFVAISQSGESVETVKTAELLNGKHTPILGITNDPESRLAKLSDQVLLTHAGKEKASSTKTFSSTLALLYELANTLAARTGRINQRRKDLLSNRLTQTILVLEDRFGGWEESSRVWAGRLASCRSAMVIGRGPKLIAALQGALLLKEVVKLPAEGLSGGEFTHGPIEAVSKDIGVIVLGGGATAGLQIKLAERAKTLGGRVLMLAPLKVRKIDSIDFGRLDEALMVFPCNILLNLLTYHAAIKNGLNPDRFNVISKITRRE